MVPATFKDLAKKGAFSPDATGLYLLTDAALRDLPAPDLKRVRAYAQRFPGLSAMEVNGRIDHELERRAEKAAVTAMRISMVTLVAAIVAAVAGVLPLLH